MNGLEFLYHILFVEKDLALWGIITMGIIFALISIVMDYGFEGDENIKWLEFLLDMMTMRKWRLVY